MWQELKQRRGNKSFWKKSLDKKDKGRGDEKCLMDTEGNCNPNKKDGEKTGTW